MKKYRITNKLRFTAFMTAFVLFSVLCFSSIFGLSDVSAVENEEFAEYYVQEGDTLWEIAQQYSPSDMDIRDYIRQVNRINNTNASSLQAGDILQLPII